MNETINELLIPALLPIFVFFFLKSSLIFGPNVKYDEARKVQLSMFASNGNSAVLASLFHKTFDLQS